MSFIDYIKPFILVLVLVAISSCRSSSNTLQTGAPSGLDESADYANYVNQRDARGTYHYLKGYANVNHGGVFNSARISLGLYENKTFLICYKEGTGPHMEKKGSWRGQNRHLMLGSLGNGKITGKDQMQIHFDKDIISPGLAQTDVDFDYAELNIPIEKDCDQ